MRKSYSIFPILVLILPFWIISCKNLNHDPSPENRLPEISTDTKTGSYTAKEEIDSMLIHKEVPSSIRPHVQKALSFYPELQNVPITFKFKRKIKKSTMQAQPVFSSIFRKRGKRSYVILISETIHIGDDYFDILDLEDDIMIGWLGHELGHVMDYRSRSGFGMMIFGLRYLYSKNYLKEAERRADSFAIRHGMGNYIIATKNFILNHSDISEKYKDRIRRLYLSPEEIMELVNTMEPEEIREEIDEEIRSDAG